jgi:5-formyltetrahydrofolate cyclo-ligase
MTGKAELRKEAFRRRRGQPNRPEQSQRIMDRLFATRPFETSRTILFYVGVRTEVRTLEHVARALTLGKKVFVPLCDADQLRLFALASVEELVPGAYGIPEPSPIARQHAERIGPIDEIDLAIVPGVAFGRDGSRLGNGRGYYDRLFRAVSGPTIRVGVAFECQMFDSLPVNDHDIWMDAVVTEAAIYGPNRRLFETSD